MENRQNLVGEFRQNQIGVDSSYMEADAVGPNIRSFSDTFLAAGTYYYRVLAYNTLGDSPYSNEAAAVIDGETPAAEILQEDFGADVFTAGWSRSDASVTVDTSAGLLRIAPHSSSRRLESLSYH